MKTIILSDKESTFSSTIHTSDTSDHQNFKPNVIFVDQNSTSNTKGRNRVDFSTHVYENVFIKNQAESQPDDTLCGNQYEIKDSTAILDQHAAPNADGSDHVTYNSDTGSRDTRSQKQSSATTVNSKTIDKFASIRIDDDRYKNGLGKSFTPESGIPPISKNTAEVDCVTKHTIEMLITKNDCNKPDPNNLLASFKPAASTTIEAYIKGLMNTFKCTVKYKRGTVNRKPPSLLELCTYTFPNDANKRVILQQGDIGESEADVVLLPLDNSMVPIENGSRLTFMGKKISHCEKSKLYLI